MLTLHLGGHVAESVRRARQIEQRRGSRRRVPLPSGKSGEFAACIRATHIRTLNHRPHRVRLELRLPVRD